SAVSLSDTPPDCQPSVGGVRATESRTDGTSAVLKLRVSLTLRRSPEVHTRETGRLATVRENQVRHFLSAHHEVVTVVAHHLTSHGFLLRPKLDHDGVNGNLGSD